MTPRDKLIEMIAGVLDDAYNKYHHQPTQADRNWLKDSCFYPQAIAIIDHLKLEVVDNNIIYGLEHCVPKKPIINIDNL